MDRLRHWLKKMNSYFIPTRHNAYRPRLLHTSWLLFFLVLALTAEGVLLTNMFAAQTARDYLAAVLPSEIVTLTNLERGFSNVATVKENPLLTEAAEAKARDMAGKGYFAHVGPGGKEPWVWIKEAGYTYVSAGENLAVRFNESADVVRAWMASESHRANIVKRGYTEIGVGVAEGTYKGTPATFVVQYFAAPSATFGEGGGESPTTAVAEVPLAVEEAQTSQVLGAAAESAAKNTVAKAVVGLGNTPTTQAFGVLAAVAVFLFILVGLAFVIKIQVQPVDLLLGGVGVAAVAVAFLILNFYFVAPSGSLFQTASVFNTAHAGVEIGEEGAFTGKIEEGILTLPNESPGSNLNL